MQNIQITDDDVIITNERGTERIYIRQYNKDDCQHKNCVPYSIGPSHVQMSAPPKPQEDTENDLPPPPPQQLVESKKVSRIYKVKCLNCGAILDIDKDFNF